MLRRIYKFYRSHFYATNGALLGLIVGISLVWIGLFKTIILCACVAVGFIIGRQLQKDKSFFRELLDKIIPPGSYR